MRRSLRRWHTAASRVSFARPVPATPGDHLSQVDTPALCLDLAAFERACRGVARSSEGVVPARLRATSRCGPLVVRGLEQLGPGAGGASCSSVAEAANLLASGLQDVLIARPVVGARKQARLASLAQQFPGKLKVVVDDEAQAAKLHKALLLSGATVTAFVAPGCDPDAAATIRQLGPPLVVGGVHCRIGQEVAALRAQGLACGSLVHDEVLAGGPERIVHVRASVVSAPPGQPALLDAGATSVDLSQAVEVLTSKGHSLGRLEYGPDAGTAQVRAEGLKPGQHVVLAPAGVPLTVNLHDHWVCHRGQTVEAVYPILGRGPGL